jgi:hypothetical protein
MKFNEKQPPRAFTIGDPANPVTLRDCGSMELAFDEQITFVGANSLEYDVVRKSWGFYATPSVNGRLGQFGLRPALAKSTSGRYYVLLLEAGKETEFDQYLSLEHMQVVCWLDNADTLDKLDEVFATTNAD